MKIQSNQLKRKAPHLTITCDLPIFKPFITLLANSIEQHPKAFSITLNYCNADYTAEPGDQESTYAIDFDFSQKQSYQLGMTPEPITACGPLFSLWQRNFCRYHSHDVYQCKISIEEA